MIQDDHILPEYCRKRILILGCGNRLFGDDGFGPAVIDDLSEHYDVPEDVYVMDVGTGVRKILFTLCLSSTVPEQIVIVDAVDKGRTPGEVFEITLDEIPFQKTDDFSLHQAPSSNLAKELKDKGVNVRVIACQVESIPPDIQSGLSESISTSVRDASGLISREYGFSGRKVSSYALVMSS
jgi:coenzyme F420 hydrogenase subunit delta